MLRRFCSLILVALAIEWCTTYGWSAYAQQTGTQVTAFSTNEATIRAQPSTSSLVLDTLRINQLVEVTGKHQASNGRLWLSVTYDNRLTGWMLAGRAVTIIGDLDAVLWEEDQWEQTPYTWVTDSKDWLHPDFDFSSMSLNTRLQDALAAKNEASLERMLTPYDFDAVQLGPLPIVITWGLDGQAMEFKDQLLESSGEFTVTPSPYVREFLAGDFREFIRNIPRHRIQVFSEGLETKIDTFSIPTPQILINFVDFTSGAIGSHISYSPFYGRYFTFTRIYSPPTENSPGTMEVIVGMPTGFDPYSTVPSIVLKAITIAFGDDVQFSSNFDVVFPIAGMQRASATFLISQFDLEWLHAHNYSILDRVPGARVQSEITINMRSGPSTEHEQVATLPPYTELFVIDKYLNEEGDLWLRVLYGENFVWIAGWLVEFQFGSLDDIPWYITEAENETKSMP